METITKHEEDEQQSLSSDFSGSEADTDPPGLTEQESTKQDAIVQTQELLDTNGEQPKPSAVTEQERVVISENDKKETILSKMRSSIVLRLAAIGIAFGATSVAATGCDYEDQGAGTSTIERVMAERRSEAIEVTIDELLEEPDKFLNKEVVVEGYPKVIEVSNSIEVGPGGAVNSKKTYGELYESQDSNSNHIFIYDGESGTFNFLVQPLDDSGAAKANGEKITVFGKIINVDKKQQSFNNNLPEGKILHVIDSQKVDGK